MMKRAIRRALTHPLLVRAAFHFSRQVAPIFMLHRFRDVEAGNDGLDPQVLRANLAWMRANKCSLLSLSELIDLLVEGAPIERAIVFTVDDGYGDFARVAAPIFAEFDCPVTVYLATGFIDGGRWMWWDKVSAACAALGREADAWPTITALKLIPESEKLARIEKLIQDSGLELPFEPPPQFSALTWDEVRRLARQGVTFGPHSVTHPVLARVGAEQSRFEITESWRRVREETGAAAVPIFCYPNGEAGDFDAREQNAVAANGMLAALSTRPGYAAHSDFSADRPLRRFQLPRFSFADSDAMLIQVVSGIERAKMAIRSVNGDGAS